MREHLLFRLTGPMASWGGPVAGELRTSEAHPTRSAILGLLGAALGLERGEQCAHDALSRQLHIAIAVEHSGHMIEDFHTTQTPTGLRGRGLLTRRHELRHTSVGTILSRRQYHCDQVLTVVLWERDGAPSSRTLVELGEALREPHWTLYLGRKSCPLGAPPEPKIVSAATPRDALLATDFESDAWLPVLQRYPRHVRFYWDASVADEQIGTRRSVSAMRRDEPIDRTRWRFANRREATGIITREAAPRTLEGGHHVPE